MKRCYQCEFTFEDQQKFCDFDGTELTVVPESVPSFKNMSVPQASLFLRVVRSRVSLTLLALGGVMVSALVVGYYDSAGQSSIEPNIDLGSNAESRNDMVNLVPDGASETLDQAKAEQASKPSFISTEQTIRVEEKTSSRPISVISRPPTTSRARAHVRSSTSKPEVNKRSFKKANKELLARKQNTESGKANTESLVRNSKRPNGRESESAHQSRDSKVVSILKKTGNILTRPFKF